MGTRLFWGCGPKVIGGSARHVPGGDCWGWCGVVRLEWLGSVFVLEDFEDEALQIERFGDGREDGVIGGLDAAFE